MTQGVTLPGEPLSVRHARRFVGEQVVGIGRGGLRSVAELLTSELVTNAIVHAGTEITVTFAEVGDRIRVAVTDGGDQPVHRPAALDGLTTAGRGLLLVDSLAADWGIESSQPGTIVWFELSPDAGDAL